MHSVKNYSPTGVINPLIINFDSIWRTIKKTPRRELLILLNMSLVGEGERSGGFGEEQILLILRRTEPQSIHSLP